MYISTSPSSEVENFPPCRGLNPGRAEPEADMLPSEPTQRALIYKVNPNKIPTCGLLSSKNCNIVLHSESLGLKYDCERDLFLSLYMCLELIG